MKPFIALEEHFMGQAILDSPSATAIPNHLFPQLVVDNLIDIGPGRIAAMDRGNTQMQVISHIPAVEPPEVCRKVNDQLFEAVKKSGSRFRGFAFPPMGVPEEIPAELERCVKEYNFVGALIPNHAKGRYYDDAAYWPMFQKAEELDVPIYIHPTPTMDIKPFRGNYPETIATLIAGPALCWHTDIAAHVIRLYGCGLFDKYPKVKIIIGHNGEAVPFMLDRIEKFLTRRWGTHKRGFLQVWNENFWITTSGMFHLGPLACIFRMVKPDRIMYSLDYPFEDPVEGMEFMEELQKSRMVSDEEFEMITWKNAKNLLKL